MSDSETEVKDVTPAPSEEGVRLLDEALERSLASVAARPRIKHVLPMTDEELFAHDVEKAAEPWLTYYFACVKGQFKKFFSDGKQDVLLSFAYFVKGPGGLTHAKVPWDLLKEHKQKGRRVMLDSGAFSNFGAPGTVPFEAYLEFLKTPEVKELFDEYVTFDDLRDRNITLRNYVKMLEEGHDPLFVDHLWHDDDEPTSTIWTSRPKVCLSGFAKTLPTQEQFPGDPKARLGAAIQRGRDVDTKVHLLAVSSTRKFLKYADRIDSVDSTAWVKASVYSTFLHTEFIEKNGVMIPIQRVYDRPGSGRKGPRFAPASIAKAAARRVREIKREFGEPSENQAFIRYSIEQTRKYVAALNAMNPADLVKAFAGGSDIEKGDDTGLEARGRGFAFISSDWGERLDPGAERGHVSKSYSGDGKDGPFGEEYKAASRSDEDLLRDWESVNDVFALDKAEPVPGTAEVILEVALGIVEEAVSRGPEFIVFDPTSMTPEQIELWGGVARRIDVPEDMVSARVLTPETSLEKSSPEELLAFHSAIHALETRVAARRKSLDWSWEELVDAHARIVEALDAAGHAHPEASGALDTTAEEYTSAPTTKADDAALDLLEKRLAAADVTRANHDPENVLKRKSPSGASRPLDGVAIEEMIVAAGPPSSWSGYVAAALGPERRRRITTFWNKSSAQTRQKLRALFEERMQADEDAVKKSASDDSGASAAARYTTHLHYVGNAVAMIVRAEKSAGGEVEMWRVPRAPLSTSVTSVEKAEAVRASADSPLPSVGEVFEVEPPLPSTRGWLSARGLTPPGGYGAGRSVPGVFDRVETGIVSREPSDGSVVLTLTPDDTSAPVRVMTLRKVRFDASSAASLGGAFAEKARSLAGDGASGESWLGRILLRPREDAVAKALDNAADGVAGEAEVPGVRTILKAEKRLVTGIVLKPEDVDAQSDIVSAEEIEQAAHRFLARYNRETQMGLMHRAFGDVGVELVESYIAPATFHLGGKVVAKGTWIMTVKVTDDELWAMCKRGEITGFSIGGVARSEKAC